MPRPARHAPPPRVIPNRLYSSRSGTTRYSTLPRPTAAMHYVLSARMCFMAPQYVSGLVGKYEANWEKEKIDLVKGLAMFVDGQTVQVKLNGGGERLIKAAKILVIPPLLPRGLYR